MAVDFLRLRSDATSEQFLVQTRLRSKDVLGTLILFRIAGTPAQERWRAPVPKKGAANGVKFEFSREI